MQSHFHHFPKKELLSWLFFPCVRFDRCRHLLLNLSHTAARREVHSTWRLRSWECIYFSDTYSFVSLQRHLLITWLVWTDHLITVSICSVITFLLAVRCCTHFVYLYLSDLIVVVASIIVFSVNSNGQVFATSAIRFVKYHRSRSVTHSNICHFKLLFLSQSEWSFWMDEMKKKNYPKGTDRTFFSTNTSTSFLQPSKSFFCFVK